MHACIYSKNVRIMILQMNQSLIFDWDGLFLIQTWGFTSKYAYYTPLCYQLHYDTENSNYWCPKSINFICDSQKYIHRLLNLDKTPQPGYNIFYFLSKLYFFILITILVLVFYYFYKTIQKRFIKRKK
jgi:hypothetical protein